MLPQWYMLCVSFGLALDLLSVLCVVLGSTADTCGASVYGVFHILRVWWIMDSQVDSRPALFLRLLGSTADTCGVSVYGLFHILRDLVDY